MVWDRVPSPRACPRACTRDGQWVHRLRAVSELRQLVKCPGLNADQSGTLHAAEEGWRGAASTPPPPEQQPVAAGTQQSQGAANRKGHTPVEQQNKAFSTTLCSAGRKPTFAHKRMAPTRRRRALCATAERPQELRGSIHPAPVTQCMDARGRGAIQNPAKMPRGVECRMGARQNMHEQLEKTNQAGCERRPAAWHVTWAAAAHLSRQPRVKLGTN